MSDNRHLAADSVHSTNSADGGHINNGISNSPNEAAAAMAAAIVAASASSSVGHLGNDGTDNVMIPFSSGGGINDLHDLRASLANGRLDPSSSNISVCLNNGNVIVNTAGGAINHLTMDGAIISNLNQAAAIGISADGGHRIIHSSEISSNGIVDDRALVAVSSNMGEQQINSNINNTSISTNNAARRNIVSSSNASMVAAATRGILANMSIDDDAGNINSNNTFLAQSNVLGHAVLSHGGGLDFTGGGARAVILPSNSDHSHRDCGRNGSTSMRLNSSGLSGLNSVIGTTHQALVGNASQNMIAVTATANIHHRASGSSSNSTTAGRNNSSLSSIASSVELTGNPVGVGGTSSANIINSSLCASTSGTQNTQNQSLWVQPDHSNYNASTCYGDLSAQTIRSQQVGTATLMLQQGPTSSATSSSGDHGGIDISNQAAAALHSLHQAVQMNGGDTLPSQLREQFSGVFQLPVQDRNEVFQAAPHSTYGHSFPATEYREINGDSEATPSYPSMHQEMSGEPAAESMNAVPTVDSSTLPQGYNLVYHTQTRKFSVQRVISPSDCTVSQSSLSLEGSEAQGNAPLMPMVSHDNQTYAMVHIGAMAPFSQSGATSEVSTSSMAAVLGVEDRQDHQGASVSSLDASSVPPSVMVLHKLQNASLDSTECDTTQGGDIEFHHSRTPSYMATSNSIDEDAGLGSSSDLDPTIPQGSSSLMDSTLDTSNDHLPPMHGVSAMEISTHSVAGSSVDLMQLSQDATVPSTSGQLHRNETNVCMSEPSGLFANVKVKEEEDVPQSSGLGMYIRKSRRLELQEQEPRASQRKRDFSYKSQPYSTKLLWCDECMCAYETECLIHHTIPVADKIVLTRAMASAPNQVQIFRLPESELEPGESGCGVFAKRQIAKLSQFGPFVAKHVDSIEEIPSSSLFPLLVEQDDGSRKYYDTSDENACNWMMFVRRAKTFAEQNLVAYQHNDCIYFSVTKLIEVKQELKVWYAAHYAERLGLKPLELTEDDMQALDEEDAKFPCFECSRKFKSSAALQKHLETVHDGDDLVDMDGADDDFRALGGDYGHEDSGGRRGKRKSLYLRGKLVQGKNRNRDGESALSYQWKKKSTTDYLNRTLKKYKKRQCTDKGVYSGRSIYRRQGKGSGESDEWICTHCGLTFDKRSLLNLHTLTHAAEDLVAGEFKTQVSENGSGFVQVEEEEEGGTGVEGMMACPKCSIVFTDQRELMNHVTSHAQRHMKRERPYECGDCNKAFVTEEKLARHRLVHGKEEDKPLECQVCHKRLINNSAMACHMKTHGERKYYDCPICHDDFDTASGLREHGLKHADINGNYPCPSCPKVFKDFTMTRKHIKAFHSDRVFECEHCGKEFPRFDKLKLHKLKHTSHREFMCETCGRQFKRKDKLMEHMKRMHSKERMEHKLMEKQNKKKKFIPKVMPTEYHRFIYKCHPCLLGFKRRGMLVNHLAKRHPEIKPEQVPELNLPILKTQRDFYCQYCDKIYKSSSKRKAHILKNHPGLLVPPSARKKLTIQDSTTVSGLGNGSFSHTVGSITTVPYGCKFCHKQYASKAKLLQHQRKKHSELVEPAHMRRQAKSIRSDYLQIAVGDPTSGLQERYETLPIAVVTQADAIPNGDLLTQAMTEIQNYQNEFITPRLSASSAPTMVHIQPNTTIDLSHLNQALQNLTSQNGVTAVLTPNQTLSHHSASPTSPGVSLVAQGGQQIHLSGSHFITRTWPTTFTTQFS